MIGKKKNEDYSDMNISTNNENLTTVANGAFINGTISVEGNFRLDGVVEGGVLCAGKMVIGTKGHVKGNVKASGLVLYGCLEGDVHTTEDLVLKSNCIMKGDICTVRLEIEPQAVFNGVCRTLGKEIPLMELPLIEASIEFDK